MEEKSPPQARLRRQKAPLVRKQQWPAQASTHTTLFLYKQEIKGPKNTNSRSQTPMDKERKKFNPKKGSPSPSYTDTCQAIQPSPEEMEKAQKPAFWGGILPNLGNGVREKGGRRGSSTYKNLVPSLPQIPCPLPRKGKEMAAIAAGAR